MENINTVSHVFYVMKSLFLLRCDWMQVKADSSKYKSRCLRFTAMYLVLLNQLVIFFANSRVSNIRGVVINSNKSFKHLTNSDKHGGSW